MITPSLRRLLRSPSSFAPVAVALSLAQPACGPSEFDMTQMIPEQHIAGSTTGGALTTFFTGPIPLGLNVQQMATMLNSGPVKTVALLSANFSITGLEMAGITSFGYLQTVNIYIESTRPNSSLPKDLVASLPTAPGNVSSISLGTFPLENLLPYINEGAHFTSTATGSIPQHETTFSGSVTVHVKTK